MLSSSLLLIRTMLPWYRLLQISPQLKSWTRSLMKSWIYRGEFLILLLSPHVHKTAGVKLKHLNALELKFLALTWAMDYGYLYIKEVIGETTALLFCQSFQGFNIFSIKYSLFLYFLYHQAICFIIVCVCSFHTMPSHRCTGAYETTKTEVWIWQ